MNNFTFSNLEKILISNKSSTLIKENEKKIFNLIPELEKCKGFEQKNIWHIYDIYEHILHVIDGVENNLILRIVALFHDIGKVNAFHLDENGVGHFYNHWKYSKDIFYKYSNYFSINDKEKELINNLIFYHDINVRKLKDLELKELTTLFSKEEIKMLYQIKRSDLLAQNSIYHNLLVDYKEQEEMILNKYY